MEEFGLNGMLLSLSSVAEGLEYHGQEKVLNPLRCLGHLSEGKVHVAVLERITCRYERIELKSERRKTPFLSHTWTSLCWYRHTIIHS